ncbi:hypothetical protein HPB52_017365 [Rhipicephalus sanguineus]|uniref:Uncharacterized protein n=1 Tax=Rhipicephalus sanguineus TaxID=34632 RepID=A0A9D4PWX8_RHISA|nr:hypothetical protein HPB52_017365 [Rhipicephalus sanguineus]
MASSTTALSRRAVRAVVREEERENPTPRPVVRSYANVARGPARPAASGRTGLASQRPQPATGPAGRTPANPAAVHGPAAATTVPPSNTAAAVGSVTPKAPTAATLTVPGPAATIPAQNPLDSLAEILLQAMRAAKCGHLDTPRRPGNTKVFRERSAVEGAATGAAGNAARPRTVAVRSRRPTCGRRALGSGPSWATGLRPLGALHVAKTKAARDGRRQHAPTPTAPPPALPDQDLAALYVERMVTSPNFAALVGTAPPAAAASAPSADDGVNDLLLDFSDENFI